MISQRRSSRHSAPAQRWRAGALPRIVRLIVAAVLACGAAGALAQAYPTKAIRLVVPYTPGGTSDILARVIGQKINEAWGKPVIVENKPGANGNIGAEVVAKAAADGYTLLLGDIGALCISPSVLAGLPFDPAKDFEPVVMISYSPHVLGVHPALPVNSVKELIALAKAKPGTLNFAMSGVGSAQHLAGVEFALRAGIQWTYVPYKGGSAAIADVVAGHADVVFNGMLGVYPFMKSGRLKALAVSAPKRIAAVPDLPTVAEAGLPGFETGSWQGVLAPAGTRREVVEKLNAEITRILSTPEVKEQLAAQGTEVRAGTPESMGAFSCARRSRAGPRLSSRPA